MPISQFAVRRALVAALIGLAAFPASAQNGSTPRIRIDAYGWVRWNNAPIDPSKGTERFHFRLNLANGRRTTGGFGIAIPGRINGTIHELNVDLASVKPTAVGPPRAVAFGVGELGGRKYTIEAIIVGDYSKPPIAANKRGTYVPGVRSEVF